MQPSSGNAVVPHRSRAWPAPSLNCSSRVKAPATRVASLARSHARLFRRQPLSAASAAIGPNASFAPARRSMRSRPRPSAAAIASRCASVSRCGSTSAMVAASARRSLVLRCEAPGISVASRRRNAREASAASSRSNDPARCHPFGPKISVAMRQGPAGPPWPGTLPPNWCRLQRAPALTGAPSASPRAQA